MLVSQPPLLCQSHPIYAARAAPKNPAPLKSKRSILPGCIVALVAQYLPFREVKRALDPIAEAFRAPLKLAHRIDAFEGKEAAILKDQLRRQRAYKGTRDQEVFRTEPWFLPHLQKITTLDSVEVQLRAIEKTRSFQASLQYLAIVCPRVESIDFSDCLHVTLKTIQILEKFKYLRTLVLRDATPLKAEDRVGLSKLQSLRYLDLQGNGITNTELPQILASLQNLQYLNLMQCTGFNITGVEKLFQQLPLIQKIDFSDDSDTFKWPNLVEAQTAFDDFTGTTFLNRRFFRSNLSRNAVRIAKSTAKIRGISLSGRAYLKARLAAHYGGCCRGYSYAMIIAQRKALMLGLAQCSPLVEIKHVQFFQALAHLARDSEVSTQPEKKPTSYDDSSRIAKIDKMTLDYLKKFAGINRKQDSTRQVLIQYEAPDFAKKLLAELHRKEANFVEITLTYTEATKLKAHSITLFQKPHYKVVDIQHGVAAFESQHELEQSLFRYFEGYKKRKKPITSINLLTLPLVT